jgi:putative ABC transport system ATP-binding protein/lipoprotein-releasing system ATP-binding protein
MIEVKNIIKRFPNTPAPVLSGINLTIEDGEFVSLVGKSGSGKSTLLYIMSTLDNPTEGEVFYDRKTLHDFKPEEIYQLRNRNIGFVFQFHYLLAELTAIENVLLPARKANEVEQRRKFALELIKTVGLEGKEHRYPGELSGGEQQRLAIARALVMEPKYLFADEPTGNLDSGNGMIIMELFKKFNREKGTTIIYVTHDVDFAAIARRKITLVDGMIQTLTS